MAKPTQTIAARKAFAKALKDHAAKQPDKGNTKLFGSGPETWSMNELATEIGKGTKRGKELYTKLKDVLKFPKP